MIVKTTSRQLVIFKKQVMHLNSKCMINLFQLYYNNGAQCVKLIQENQYVLKTDIYNSKILKLN
jgi:hypothetical protein